MKKTLVMGASTNPERYSFLAANKLVKYGHEIELLGNKTGEMNGHKINTGTPDFKDIDTVTLYLSPKNQTSYYDYIIGLKPKRIIFNPGTENAELETLAQSKGIETIEACTLVLLSIGGY